MSEKQPSQTYKPGQATQPVEADAAGSAAHEPPPTNPTRLQQLDTWMEASPLHPRIVPYFAYVALLAVIGYAREPAPWTYPILYTGQCLLVAWLLWRYRKLTPEMNFRFHWLVVPSAVFLTVGWVALGWLMAGELGTRWSALMNGEPIGMFDYSSDNAEPNRFASTEPHYFEEQLNTSPALAWTSLSLRLLGMSLLVPFFEELMMRSLVLRSFQRVQQTAIGIVQVAEDLPIVGDWIMKQDWGKRYAAMPNQFARQFHETPVGAITVFGIFASSVIFSLGHLPRDWPGAMLCGAVWCLMLWWTNRAALGERKLALGPIIWSHGLTNALLWAYCVWSGDWQFM